MQVGAAQSNRQHTMQIVDTAPGNAWHQRMQLIPTADHRASGCWLLTRPCVRPCMWVCGNVAGALAGLETVRIIREPVAAALAYGLNLKQDQTVCMAIIQHCSKPTWWVCLVSSCFLPDCMACGCTWLPHVRIVLLICPVFKRYSCTLHGRCWCLTLEAARMTSHCWRSAMARSRCFPLVSWPAKRFTMEVAAS